MARCSSATKQGVEHHIAPHRFALSRRAGAWLCRFGLLIVRRRAPSVLGWGLPAHRAARLVARLGEQGQVRGVGTLLAARR
eukprot:2418756-Alexandrium_andersonii.AAC.1